MGKWLMLYLGLAVGVADAQQVFRCQDAAGQPVFQHHPCATGTGSPIPVSPMNMVEGDPQGDRGVRQQAARAEVVDRAIARGEVIVGMTAAEVRRVLGEPSSVRSWERDAEEHQELVYRRADGSLRVVILRSGRVRALERSQRQSTSIAVARWERPCHGAQEIENARTSASSITLTSAERREAQQRVREMARCMR